MSLLFTVFFLLAGANALGQPRVLQEYSANAENNSSTLTLYVDNTFKYGSRGSSCWLWGDWKGTWSMQAGFLYLTYSFTVNDPRDEITVESNLNDRSRIVVVVADESGLPLRDARVTFNGHGYESTTGADGHALVEYEDIPEAVGSGWCKSKDLTQLIVTFGDRTMTFSVGKPQSNYFEVLLDMDPPSHRETYNAAYQMTPNGLVLVLEGGEGADEADSPPWVKAMKPAEIGSP